MGLGGVLLLAPAVRRDGGLHGEFPGVPGCRSPTAPNEWPRVLAVVRIVPLREPGFDLELDPGGSLPRKSVGGWFMKPVEIGVARGRSPGL
jgi:hypothetical protein